MKIVYITLLNLTASSGAVEHVVEICRGLTHVGNDVHLVALGENQCCIGDVQYHAVYSNKSISSMAMDLARHALNIVNQIHPDVVYLRSFPMDFIFLTRHLNRMGVPYVCELNTLIDAEYRAKRMQIKGVIYSFFENLTLAKSIGWLPVTTEIANYATRKSKRVKPTLIAGNGVSIENIHPKRSRNEVRESMGVEEDAIVLVMSGFSYPWHGVDRAIAMLQKISVPVELWLIGARNEKERSRVEDLASKYGVSHQLKVLPWCAQSETVELVSAADIGIGPLALDRKNMFEAQPLKVRFYLASGLSVFINYIDPLLSSEDSPFIEYVDSVNPDDLARGIDNLIMREYPIRDEIRNFAQANLGWGTIARKTDKFLREVLSLNA